MSQNRWAQKLGLHKGHLSRLTNGQRPYPGAETRRRLLEGLGLPFEELFEIEGADAPPGRLTRTLRRLRRSFNRWQPAVTKGWTGDCRQAFRALRRQPGFAFLALVTIALGVGANTAIFTLVNGILLQPLPFHEPQKLVYIWSVRNEGTTLGRISYADYVDATTAVKGLESLAALNADDLTWIGDGGAERVSAELVTAPFFAALGVPPAAGRPLLLSETNGAGSSAVVVISHDFWQAKLGGAAGVVGSQLRLNGLPHEVVGVMPEGFRGLEGTAQLWVPLTQIDALHPDLKEYELLESRGTRFLVVIGRMKADSTPAAAQQQLTSLAAQLAVEYPRTNEDKGLRAEPLGEVIRGDFRTPVLWLMGAVGVVLLIAVANLAHLSLARSAQRVREIAIRTALGAQAPRLIRHLLTESLLLSVAGGLAGVVLAQAALVRILPLLPDGLPSYVTLTLDGRVLAFSILLSVVVGVAFGLAPALLAVRHGASEALKQNSVSLVAGRSRRRMTSALVVAEVALSVALLAGAGLMLQGLYRATAFNPGYKASGLITASFDLPVYKFSEDEQQRLLNAIIDHVASLPSVSSASLSSHHYFGDGYMTGGVFRAEDTTDREIRTQMMWVSPGFFRTLGIQLQEGRDFSGADRADSLRVSVINRRLAEEAWPGESPLGKKLRQGRSLDDATTVVGVVDDVQTRRGSTPSPSQLYYVMSQGGLWSRALMVRSQQPDLVLGSLRSTIQQVDPEIPIFQVTSMESMVAQTFASTRLLALLTTLFAAAALLLATIGVYGVMAFTVSQARAEVGIRLAIGARPADVIRHFMIYGGLRAVAGLAIGLALAVALSETVASQLADVEPFDLPVFAGVSLLLLAAAQLAAFVPAWRASRVNPLETVRAQ